MSGLTVAEVLDRAADLIEPEGWWTQGTSQGLGPHGICYCLAGAIEWASQDADYDRLMAAFSTVRSVIRSDIAPWNDAPERTQAEVVAKLREAAAAAREVQS